MNETLFYHVIATAAHGDYHKIKKYRGSAASWEEAREALAKAACRCPIRAKNMSG